MMDYSSIEEEVPRLDSGSLNWKLLKNVLFRKDSFLKKMRNDQTVEK